MIGIPLKYFFINNVNEDDNKIKRADSKGWVRYRRSELVLFLLTLLDQDNS